MQALLKDTREEEVAIWLERGLAELAKSITELCGLIFSQTHFQRLFSTLCVLIEHNFGQISGQLEAFFTAYSTTFLQHNNKYVRKFALQALSYLLSNLSQEEYRPFMTFLLRLQAEGFFR